MVGKKLLPYSHPLSGDKPFDIWIVDSAGKEVRLMEFASREEQLVWEAHRSSRERKNRIAEGSPNKKFHASASDVGKVRSAKELRQQRKPTQWVVDEIGASGACVLLGADKGSGKTSLLYQLANSISKGVPFMDQLPTQKRKVVVVQGDESSTNASDKLDIMGIDADFDFVFPEEMGWQGIEVPKLSKLIDDNSYGAVLLDSVTTLLGNGTQGFRMNDAEFAAPLYQLNNLASKKNLLIMITSHLRKADTQQPRGISLDDILGAGTQSAAVSDVWGMWRHDKPEFEDHYIMQCLGKRNCQQGTAWNLQGSQEDYSWVLRSAVNPSDLLPACRRQLKEQIMQLLNNSNELLHHKEIAKRLGCNEENTRRICRALTTEQAISRFQAQSTGGRPAWLYGRRTFPT